MLSDQARESWKDDVERMFIVCLHNWKDIEYL